MIVMEADDRKAAELAMIENLQREDLNPIEEANGYKVLMSEYGLTQEEVAQRVGKSRPAVANALRLLALPDPVHLLLEEGKLSAGHARAILATRFGRKVHIINGRKKGKIELEYYNPEDLNTLLELLEQLPSAGKGGVSL